MRNDTRKIQSNMKKKQDTINSMTTTINILEQQNTELLQVYTDKYSIICYLLPLSPSFPPAPYLQHPLYHIWHITRIVLIFVVAYLYYLEGFKDSLYMVICL